MKELNYTKNVYDWFLDKVFLTLNKPSEADEFLDYLYFVTLKPKPIIEKPKIENISMGVFKEFDMFHIYFDRQIRKGRLEYYTERKTFGVGYLDFDATRLGKRIPVNQLTGAHAHGVFLIHKTSREKCDEYLKSGNLEQKMNEWRYIESIQIDLFNKAKTFQDTISYCSKFAKHHNYEYKCVFPSKGNIFEKYPEA